MRHPLKPAWRRGSAPAASDPAPEPRPRLHGGHVGVSDHQGHLERHGTTEALPMKPFWKNGSQGFVLQFSSTIFTVYNLKSNEHSAGGKADFYAIKQILTSCRILSYIVFFLPRCFLRLPYQPSHLRQDVWGCCIIYSWDARAALEPIKYSFAFKNICTLLSNVDRFMWSIGKWLF